MMASANEQRPLCEADTANPFDAVTRAFSESSDDPVRAFVRCVGQCVAPMASRLGVRDAHRINDLSQSVLLRIAELEADRPYDPTRASVRTYVNAVGWREIWGSLGRRPKPPMVPLDVAVDPPSDEDPSTDLEQADTKAWLRGLLEPLSDGEVRALANALGIPVHRFWNVIGHRPPKRIGASGDALARAFHAFKKLRQSGW